MSTHGPIESLKIVGSIAGAIAAIAGLIFLFFPQFQPAIVTSKAVQISDVKVENPVSASSGDCNYLATVNLKVRVEGYQDKPVSLYARLDQSPTANANRSLCATPIGRWDDWQRAEPTFTLTATAPSQQFPVRVQVRVPWIADNWKIQLRVTDSNGAVLETAETALFNIR